MSNIRFLDGRKTNEIPDVIELTDYTICGTWQEFGLIVHCLKIDDRYVPCEMRAAHVYRASEWHDYDAILCGEYKTFRGFEKYWLSRQHEYAQKINWL